MDLAMLLFHYELQTKNPTLMANIINPASLLVREILQPNIINISKREREREREGGVRGNLELEM
jgi:hypothetical protein